MRAARMKIVAAVVTAMTVMAAMATGPTVPSAASAEPTEADYVVVLDPASTSPADAAADAANLGAEVTSVYGAALDGFAATMTPDEAAAVASDPDVAFVAPDRPVERAAVCDPATCQRMHRILPRTGQNSGPSWLGDATGEVPVDVAVIDDGVDDDHPDLDVQGGVNCTDDGLDPYGDPDLGDFGWHGTFVGGVLGARNDSGYVVGAAPGVDLWSARVFDVNGEATTSGIVCAIEWVTATRSDADPTNDIEVVNMSLGDDEISDDGNCGLTAGDPMHVALCASVDAGVTYVVAAMNDAIDLGRVAPASYDEVLTVTAMSDTDGQPGQSGSRSCYERDDRATSFSNFAVQPGDQAHTVAAPGTCIWSTWPGPSLSNGSGTSYAAPQVAGQVARCIASGACAGLDPAGIVAKVVGDAHLHAAAHPGYGFRGDPTNPLAGRYYGPLVWGGDY